MSTIRCSLRIFFLTLAITVSVGTAWATNVTLRLVDQSGNLIPGSQFAILTAGNLLVPQEGVAEIPAGTHTIRLDPRVSGVNGLLRRDETVSVSGMSQTVEFVWKLATVEVNLVDQNVVLIPASRIALGFPPAPGQFSSFVNLANGGSVRIVLDDGPAMAAGIEEGVEDSVLISRRQHGNPEIG